jgi:hypothetical protein
MGTIHAKLELMGTSAGFDQKKADPELKFLYTHGIEVS